MKLIFHYEFIFYTSSKYVWNLPTLSLAWFFFFHVEFRTMWDTYVCNSLICIYLFFVTLNLISVYHVICEKNKRNTQNSVSKKHSTLSQIIQIDKKVESRKSYFYVVCIYILQSVPYRKEHLNVSSLNLTLFSYQN